MGGIWSRIQSIVNYHYNNINTNDHLLNNSAHPKEVFKHLLEQRVMYASEYINSLYLSDLNTIKEENPYLQWHSINENTQIVDLYKFIGLNIKKNKKGTIQAWDLGGISKIDKYQLCAPIEIVSDVQLLNEGFNSFQIDNINGVIKLLHDDKNINKNYTYGLATCSVYEDVLYIANNKIKYNEITRKSDNYKETELTNIYLGKCYGNNNINYNNIIDIIRQIVYIPPHYNTVFLNFNKTEYSDKLWNIGDFMIQDRFMNKEEIFQKYPEIFPKLNKKNVTVTLSKNGILVINIPEMFFVDSKIMKKMVIVPSTNNNIHNKKLNKIKNDLIYSSNNVLFYYNNNNIDFCVDTNLNNWVKIDIN